MTVVIIRKSQAQPEPEKPYTILDALNEKVHGRKGTLMFVHSMTGLGYTVVGHSPGFETKLRGPDHKYVHAKITEREAALYKPIWRV